LPAEAPETVLPIAPAHGGANVLRFSLSHLTPDDGAAKVKSDEIVDLPGWALGCIRTRVHRQEDVVVTVRSFLRSAAAFGMVFALPCLTLAAERFPAALPPSLVRPAASVNQQLADIVAASIQSSAQLRGYHVDVVVQDGVVELTGVVANLGAHDEVVRLVQSVPGVEHVLDRIQMSVGQSGLVAVQLPAVPGAPAALPPVPGAKDGPSRLPEPNPGAPIVQGPTVLGAPGAPTVPEPVPAFAGTAPGPYDLGAPRMPPYAWPTYAPYNNFSRVAVPEAYPYNAWPFIGPMYPFPKVPPGWRSVKLEWDDGYWWFSKVGNKYDWWRLRFW
jgi:BON domain